MCIRIKKYTLYASIYKSPFTIKPQFVYIILYIVCIDSEKSHASISGGYKIVCGNCVKLLNPKRRPLCNDNLISVLRV